MSEEVEKVVSDILKGKAIVSAGTGLRYHLEQNRDHNLLVWQVQSLRTLLMHAVMAAPDLLDAGAFDAPYALLYRLITEAVSQAQVVETEDGPKKKPGNNFKAEEWELRIFCQASASVLAKLDRNGRGKKGRAEKMVRDMAVAAGFPMTQHYFKNAKNKLEKKFPKNTPINIFLTEKGTGDMLLAQHNRGDNVLDQIREGVAMRVRVVNMMKAERHR